MSTHSEVMHCYEQMASLTERMLVLARTDQWAGLPELEAIYSDRIAHLQRLNADGLQAGECCEGGGAGLDESQRSRQRVLLARIQSRHLAVCQLVAPQVAHLSSVLRSLEWRCSLQSTYSQPGSALL